MIPNGEHHYEFDPDNEEPYWEPSSREDELKIQIQMLRMDKITADSLRLVYVSNKLSMPKLNPNNKFTFKIWQGI